MDSRIRLRHLRCFTETCRQNSITAAANRLALSQPAVSKTISELEDILATPLLTRSKKGVLLTDAGKQFLRYANHALAVLEEGVDSLTDNRSSPQNPVSVGALPSVASQWLPAAIDRFRELEADAVVRIIAGPNAYLLEQLKLGSLDLVFGLLADPRKMTGLNFTPLYSEQLALTVRPGHPLLRKRSWHPSNLAQHRLILPIAESITRQAVDQWLITQGVTAMPDVIETVSASFGRQALLESDAIWLISRGVVSKDIDAGILAELPADTSTTASPVGITSRTQPPPSPAAAAFMSVLQQLCTHP